MSVSTGFNKINIFQKLCPWATCSSGIWELGVSIRKWGGVSKTYADLLHFTVFELVAVSFYGGVLWSLIFTPAGKSANFAKTAKVKIM